MLPEELKKSHNINESKTMEYKTRQINELKLSPDQVSLLSVLIENLPTDKMPDGDVEVLAQQFESQVIDEMLQAPECVLAYLLGCTSTRKYPTSMWAVFEQEIRRNQLRELNGKLMLADAVTAIVGTLKPTS